jgi:hypothetical protein
MTLASSISQKKKTSRRALVVFYLNQLYDHYKGNGGWRAVSKHAFDGKIPAGTLSRIARGGYLPSKPLYRSLLGLTTEKRIIDQSPQELLLRLKMRRTF